MEKKRVEREKRAGGKIVEVERRGKKKDVKM